jgi:hypothetical protein
MNLFFFYRYFYGELHQLAHGLSPIRNIFVDPHTGKLHLRNTISLHLILSDAPNGDAKEYLPSDTNNYLNAYDAVRIFLHQFNLLIKYRFK